MLFRSEFEFREPIYRAQQAVLQQTDQDVVDFRLVNLQELEGEPEEFLPSDRELLFKR